MLLRREARVDLGTDLRRESGLGRHSPMSLDGSSWAMQSNPSRGSTAYDMCDEMNDLGQLTREMKSCCFSVREDLRWMSSEPRRGSRG